MAIILRSVGSFGGVYLMSLMVHCQQGVVIVVVIIREIFANLDCSIFVFILGKIKIDGSVSRAVTSRNWKADRLQESTQLKSASKMGLRRYLHADSVLSTKHFRY